MSSSLCGLQYSASFIFVFTFGQVFDLAAVEAAAHSLSLGRSHKISHALILSGGPQMTSDCPSKGATCRMQKWVGWSLCGRRPGSLLSKHFSVVSDRSINECGQQSPSMLCSPARPAGEQARVAAVSWVTEGIG